MSLSRYSEYKASGACLPSSGSSRDRQMEWLGDVPRHWEVKRLKQVCHVFPSNVDKKSHDGETPVKLCNYTDVYYNDTITADMEFMAATASTEQIAKFTLRAGDTIITKDSETADDIAISAYVPADLPGVICGYHLSMIRPKVGTHGAFVKQLFDSTYVKSCVEVRANGLTRVGLGQYQIDNLELPFPPVKEQQTIAAFLDRETGKIDALIAEQRRLVELLGEKRQAVISHAVTKGLNPNAPACAAEHSVAAGRPMKDSGIEWLGEVPEHWDVCSIKRMTLLITDGAHISPETDDGVYDFVSTKDVSDAGIDFEGCLKTSPSSYEYLVRTGCQPARGDVLFSKDGTIGRTVVVKVEREFVVASSLIIIRPDSRALDSIFLHYLCQSFLVIQQVEGFVKGAGLPRLSIQNLLKVFGVFPQLEEQQAIATFLDTETAKFDTLTTESNRVIALLQERRSALISAAVTGKIDVRCNTFESGARDAVATLS